MEPTLGPMFLSSPSSTVPSVTSVAPTGEEGDAGPESSSALRFLFRESKLPPSLLDGRGPADALPGIATANASAVTVLRTFGSRRRARAAAHPRGQSTIPSFAPHGCARRPRDLLSVDGSIDLCVWAAVHDDDDQPHWLAPYRAIDLLAARRVCAARASRPNRTEWAAARLTE